MALPTVKLKRSSVAGKIPDSSDLAYGELAVNYTDGKIYYKNSSNAIKSFLDSANIVDLIDSNYVQTRRGIVDSNGLGALSVSSAKLQANIPDTKLATISTAGKVSNSATTATSANTASAIVARDASGNFTAGVVSATQFVSTNNATGKNYQIGDDAWIGDVNVANTTRISGAQDSSQGYIIFGNANNVSLGRSGTGPLTYGGIFSAVELTSTNAAGDEGGQINLAIPLTNTTLGGNVTVDVYQNRLRIFEGSGNAKGAYIDLSACANNAGTNILGTGTPGDGTLTLAVSGTGLSGSASFTANQSGNSTFTVTSNATSANTVSTIVARDASGNFSAGTITAALAGNASTATSAATLTTGRNFSLTGEVTAPAVSFNGSGAVALSTTIATDAVDSSNILALSVSSAKIQNSAVTTAKIATGAVDSNALGALSVSSAKLQANIPDSKLATISTAGKVSNSATTATNLNTANAIVARDGSGNFTAGTITAALSGNASTATTLATGRDFSLTGEVTAPAVSFNGSGVVALNTTIAANAVDSSNILALSVSSAKIQNSAVTTAKIATGAVDSNALGALSVSAAKLQANIPDSKLATISTAGKVANSATTATNANTANAIVTRDASGNFSAGTITAALTGTASNATTLASNAETAYLRYRGTITETTLNDTTTDSARTSGFYRVSYPGASDALLDIGGIGGSTPRVQFRFNYGDEIWFRAARDTETTWDGISSKGKLLLHTSNYNSYAPTLTGTGASGNWGINITGSAATLTTGRNFSLTGPITAPAVSFNGSGAVALATAITAGAVDSNALGALSVSSAKLQANIPDSKLATISTASKVANSATTATNANTANAIVARDGSGNFSAGTITAALSGNASTATSAGTLTTSQNFSLTGPITAPAVSFNGSGAVALATAITAGAVDSNALGALSVSSAKLQANIPDSKLATISTAGKVANSATTATNANTANAIVARDGSGNFSAGTITAALSGNASTATTLATGRDFSLTGEVTAPAVSFNGSGVVALNTTIAANAVDSSNILALSVSAAKIQSGAVTTAKLAAGAVDSNALGALSVSSAKIQNNAVTLGTQTTGNYVANASAANGVKITGTAGEGWTPTVSLDSSGTGTIGNLTVSSNLVVNGNLTVSGTTTTINTETITLNDNIIVLNNNATGVPTENAGIEIERGDSANVLIRWNETSNRWSFTNDGTNYHNIPTSDEYIDSATSKFPTTYTWTGGTTSGPTGSLTGTNLTAISFGAIPSASATASGIVTTDTQTFAGAKTFSSTITGSVTGNAGTATTLATGRDFSLTGEVTAPAISFNGSGVVALNTTIAANAVDSSNILALSVSAAKIQSGAVTTAKIATGAVDSNALGALSVSAAKLQANIPDSKLATISTAGKVANSATTATNANTANAIVTRDGSGNFSAGTITAALTGAASSNVLKAGDTMTGKLNLAGNDAARLIETLNTSASSAVQFYVEHNLGATNVGNARGVLNLVSTGALTIGGSVALTASNYNTYSPTLTGTGASGNWGINITGSAATLTTARDFSLTGEVTAPAISFNGSGAVALNTTIAANAVDSSNILALSVSAAKIQSAAVTTAKLATGAVDSNALGALSVSSAKLQANIPDSKLATISTAGKVSNSATTATNLNTASAIVARDGSGNFTAGTITAALSGNASTATTLATGRDFSLTGEVTAPTVSFNGSGAVALSTTIAANAVDSSNILALSVSSAKIQSGAVTTAKFATGAVDSNALGALSVSSAKLQANIPDSKLATISTAGKVSNSATTATNLNTASAIVARDGSGNFTAGTITAALSGNATTASTLQTARNIGGVSFNGSADINLPGVNTAGNQNTSGSAATLTTARTIGDVSFNGSANIVPERILFKDTRAVNHNPYTYPGTTLHLKTNTTDGLADGGTYHGVLDLQHWSDSSGGKNHQLGLTDNNNIYIRASTNATTWGSWVKIIDSGDTTALNTANTLVRRDASGNFSAGTITTAALDTATAATHYYVETASDGAIRPKTLANVQTEVVTTTVLGSGTANGTTYLAGDRTWKTVSAGATGGGTDTVFFENSQVVTTNYTITNGKNAMTAGPVTINDGVTITVGDGEVWTIV